LRSRQTTAQAMTSQTSAQNPNQMSHFHAIGPSLQAPRSLKHGVCPPSVPRGIFLMTLPFGHIFQLKERYGVSAFVLNPHARTSQLHVIPDQLKGRGRGWSPFARIFDACTCQNDETPKHTVPRFPRCITWDIERGDGRLVLGALSVRFRDRSGKSAKCRTDAFGVQSGNGKSGRQRA
jgi:hypothetical protein